MNERNVAMLRDLILERDIVYHTSGPTAPSLLLAEYLASRGVLVPQALTEHDATYFCDGYFLEGEMAGHRASVAAELERIAKGQAGE